MTDRENKYFALLIRMKKECEEGVFDSKLFLSYSRVDSSFLKACVKMGFIDKIKNKWKWLIEEPTEPDATFIVELVNDYVKEIQEKEYSDFNNNILNKVR